MDDLNPRHLRALGCRCLGCALLLFLVAVVLCALLFTFVFRLVGQVHAAEWNAARHFVLLVDQSRSVVGNASVQALARDATLATIEVLRTNVGEDDLVRVFFFGAESRLQVEAMWRDDSLDEEVWAAFDRSQPHTQPAGRVAEGIRRGVRRGDQVARRTARRGTGQAAPG